MVTAVCILPSYTHATFPRQSVKVESARGNACFASEELYARDGHVRAGFPCSAFAAAQLAAVASSFKPD